MLHEHFDIDRLSLISNAWSIGRTYSQNDSAGIFGQLHYQLTEKLGITGGLRFSREEHILDTDAYSSNASGEKLTQTFNLQDLKTTDTGLTPKVSIDYAWTPNVFSYATWAKGQTSGGWNAGPVGRAALAQVSIEPEKVTSYETGLKINSFSGRLQTNVALFYNDYDNYQTNLTNPVIGGSAITGTVLSNVDKAHTYGAELETSLKVTPQLQVNFTAALLKSKFDQFLPSGTTAAYDYTGNELPNAPHQSYALSGIYDVPVWGGDLRLNGSLRYASRYYVGPENTRESPAQTLADASAAFTPGGSSLTFTLAAKNLFDRTYGTDASYGTIYNPPRQVLAGVRYDF